MSLFKLFILIALPIHAETLRYTVKWPSGLTMGEATLSTGPQTFVFELDASLPAYAIQDRYASATTPAQCTVEFTRESHHGSKSTDERITVTPGGKATRKTHDGGSSEWDVDPCSHDALALLSTLRASLRSAQLPPAQTVLFGAGYPVRFEILGPETIRLNEKPLLAEKVVCILTLPKTGDYRLELFFLPDSGRTPALIRAPFSLGAFTMELNR